MAKKKKLLNSSLPETIRYEEQKNHIGLERLIFFSDAVFAIAITLLALDVRLPAGAESLTDAELYRGLLSIWQKYLAYIMSFLVIGSFWNAHHRKFQFIIKYNNRLMLLNLLVLMVVAFLPFSSSIISISGTRTATIFYALTMILVGIFYALLWWYAAFHANLVESHLTKQQRRKEFLTPLATVMILILSIGITQINSDLGRLSWILILPATLFINKG